MAMAMAMIPSLALFATCIAAIWSCNGNTIASAASPSPSPAPSAADCSAVVYEMLLCADYINIGSTKANASKECCKAVGNVLKKNAACMCDSWKRSGRMGIHLNLTRTLGLPVACGISSPPPPDCDIPLPPGMAPAPVPNTKAPSPAPGAKAPTPFPGTKAPSPAPSTKAPTPAPSTKAPTPAPSTRAPAPAPTTKAPAPAPTKAPTPAPVNPPAPVAPTPAVSPSNAPMSPPAPLGPSSEDSPALAPSDAPSFTISSNLIVPLLLALVTSFRPL